jgi:PAS domain S-box-containing protein
MNDLSARCGCGSREERNSTEGTLPGSRRSLAGYLRLAALLALLYMVSRHQYLLFHAAAELFSVIIAVVIFVIAWNARQILDSHFYLFIGIASLFVGIIDLLHLLAYQGMGVFAGMGPDIPTQLWVAGRYLQSFSLLAAPIFLRRSFRTDLVLALFAAVTAVLVFSIFVWKTFPACYVDGAGLTAFKIGSEYVVSLILAGAMVHLVRSRAEIDGGVLRLLLASIGATIVAELLFSVYIGLSGRAMVAGHISKILSFYLLYRAMIETALVRPQLVLYHKMKASEEALREERNVLQNYLDIAGVIIVALKRDQTVAMINRKGEAVLGRPRSEIIGRNWLDIALPEDQREPTRSMFQRLLEQGLSPAVEAYENTLVAGSGERRLFAWHNTILCDEAGKVIGTLSSGEDITERKKYESDRELLIQDLRTVLERVKMLSGLLPICSSCKKVRDDKGYWSQVETYIEDHSNAHFTHGICPECAVRLYPHLFKDGMPDL